MSKFPHFADDDENNTLFFEWLETHVLENYPNSQRIGCPGHKKLESFIEKPGKMGLAELDDRHIFNCAECVRELLSLRDSREERLRLAASHYRWQGWFGWRSATIALFVCALLISGMTVWRNHVARHNRLIQAEATVALTLDLSGDGTARGAGTRPTEQAPSFPRKLVNLRLILPYYSPTGDYRITITREKNLAPLQVERASAVAHGSSTELQVRLDLSQVSPGHYYLGTAHDGEAATYFYPVTLD